MLRLINLICKKILIIFKVPLFKLMILKSFNCFKYGDSIHDTHLLSFNINIYF